MAAAVRFTALHLRVLLVGNGSDGGSEVVTAMAMAVAEVVGAMVEVVD